MRHAWTWLGGPIALLMCSVTASCGGKNTSQFGSGDAGRINLGGNDGGGISLGGDGGGVVGGGEGGSGIDGGPPCTGTLCDQSMVDNCAGSGMPYTSISGVVYDPAGAVPLYDVYVYIPGSVPDDIDPGNPACTPCEAPASGGPIIGTLTDEQGKFNLVQASATGFGVPSGTNIPLVIQTGKWRKQITLPTVTKCGATAIADPAAPADKLRLPANSSEGDMPIIAFTSGCDPAECFLRHIGIADSEFVPPTAPLPVAWKAGATPVAGAGHVRFYTGRDEMAAGGGGRGGGPGSGSTIPGGNTSAETYAWWTNSANLLENDIVFNACECSPYDRGAAAYPAMDAYLNGGGRLFTTHYYYNWFAAPTGTADLQSVAQWNPNNDVAGSNAVETDAIDTTFPKGAAFATWLEDNAITTTTGVISLGDYRDNLNGLEPVGCEAAGTCLSTQWIYNAAKNHPRYISFNTPVATPAASQCGRAVFSDVHLSGSSNDQAFPNECTNPDPKGIHTTNEKALEFLFFDLSSCVQNDKAPPTMPPPTGTVPK